MNLAVILTAARHGAAVANHVKVTDLMKDANGQLCGAKVKVRQINAFSTFFSNFQMLPG